MNQYGGSTCEKCGTHTADNEKLCSTCNEEDVSEELEETVYDTVDDVALSQQ